jgi:hypothetical protein
MAEDKKEAGIKEYADGWITEREGTEVPGFLKLAFPIIALGCVAYLIVYMNGETTHPDRGALVQKFNEVAQSSSSFMYFVAALGLVFTIIVVGFAFRKNH